MAGTAEQVEEDNGASRSALAGAGVGGLKQTRQRHAGKESQAAGTQQLAAREAVTELGAASLNADHLWPPCGWKFSFLVDLCRLDPLRRPMHILEGLGHGD